VCWSNFRFFWDEGGWDESVETSITSSIVVWLALRINE
jgi:hypothetical protein